jgi:hydrogenase 3 maturation protease
MPNLQKTLRTKLKGAKRIAILGVGSDLRADDVAGEQVVKTLKAGHANEYQKRQIRFFLGATAPENLTGEVKKFNPTHLIIVDSAQLGKKAGTIRLLAPREIGGISFSTHRLPTKVMVDYLRKSLDCRVIIIGIQPKSLVFGKSLSGEVRKSVKELSTALKDALF